MLKFYRGGQLEILANQLIELYNDQPLEDPLAQEILVVQNHGMAQWLSTRIARKSGIAANLKFEFPAERVWDLYRCMDEDIPKDLPSDREPMTWTLYQLLQNVPRKSPFLSVWNYMRDTDGQWNALKAWKLANRVGDLFDQYLIYRPGMIKKWEREDRIGYGANEAWQSALWRELNKIWDDSFTEIQWNYRAAIHSDFLKLLKNNELSTDELPQRITLFGLSGLPPSSIEVFMNLSKLIDIHWFWMNPGDDSAFMELAESWGGEGKEFLDLFKEHASKAGISVPAEKKPEFNGLNTSHTPDLFDQLKDPTFNAEGPNIDIQVHSCHSPLREVEVLHNNLLDFFEKNPDLQPDDILVLCPNITLYAPFIEAVFSTTEKEQPAIPHHIVEDHTGLRKEVFNIFAKLLTLLDSRFKVTEVLDLLSARVIRQRFDISEDELERLQNWIKGTNVRWGLSGEDKQQLELPGTARFTWMAGLDRMMLGFATDIEDEVFQEIYPFSEIESSEDADLLGKLSRFVNALQEARRRSRKAKSPKAWEALLRSWITDFIPSDQKYYHAYQGLNALIDGMQGATGLAGFQEDLQFPVLVDYLENKLMGEAVRGGYFGHGITFSGLEQMRNIPFKVIGMIGMDNEAFPRNKVSPDFDLMTQAPKPGDRLQRNDDRYLFLETLHSAQELFYLSYVGQSNRDDSSRPPSVMITELIDYLREEYGIDRNEILVKHPLQAYSKRYFYGEDPALFSYSPTAFEIQSQLSSGSDSDKIAFLTSEERLSEADESFKNISVDELVRFCVHPARFLVQQRLGIQFYGEDLISEDREPFELDGLSGYKLGEELLMRRLHDKDIGAFEPIAQARGMLPEGWPGRQEFEEKVDEITEFSTALRQLLSTPKLDRKEVSLEFGEFHLTGVLEDLYSDYQLFFRYGVLRPKDLLRQWIYHLVLLETQGENSLRDTLLVTKKDDQPAYTLFSKVPDPFEKLDALVHLYWEGLHKKIPLFTDSSYAFAEELLVKSKDEERALRKANNKWESSWNPGLNEKENPFNKLLFKYSEPIESQEFKNLSLKIWSPILDSLQEEHNVE
ncbi:exodeoxyribonuclease V subunit gamma [Aliifodinibius sp. S!AR15-10]|uniref:exodeoxyribonuclease V subunit gamma n=1 Tax=Aliifodinibius sp. S!AR15-10 TaxID=2950437 RepID=UPI0028641184|nr:exodeoxyribonuclease V subunit gamma [Aliifodinibius sp. S!AR15-10]MDR8391585.1 exodeoxyribonuclease V subunit gamma [Aliifodinibius sp. S!AR15-10]